MKLINELRSGINRVKEILKKDKYPIFNKNGIIRPKYSIKEAESAIKKNSVILMMVAYNDLIEYQL